MATRHVEWIEDELRLEQLAEAWDRLVDEVGLPFMTQAWLIPWWRAFRGGRRLRVCTAWADGVLEGVFPLAMRGGRLESLANVHSPVFMPVAVDALALEALCRAVLDGREQELVVSSVPSESAAVGVLQDASRRLGRMSLVEPQHVSPIVEISGSFADYRKRMNAKTRAGLDRRRRKLEREHNAVFSVVETPADLNRELDRGFALEASGWKGRRGTAIVSAAETEIFYREVARRFAARGQLRLSGISVDGELIAFDLLLLAGNRLYLVKTAYDESYARFTPGLILRMATIERCFELGLDAHELLGDVAPWKLRFATTSRRHCAVRTFRRAPIGLAGYLYRRRVRPVLKWGYRRVRSLPSRRRTKV